VAGNAGIAFTDLGMPDRAEQYLAAAVDLTAASPFLHSLYLARQAKTAIRGRQPDTAGQPDTAAQTMVALAAVAPMVDSPGCAFTCGTSSTEPSAGAPSRRSATLNTR
jgi:hypothetical protein